MRLARRTPDGATYRDHLRVAAQAGMEVPELDPLPVPAGCEGLLQAFWRLRRAAGSNGMAPNPITFESLVAWQEVHGVRLTPWEVETVVDLDVAALEVIREQQWQQQSAKS